MNGSGSTSKINTDGHRRFHFTPIHKSLEEILTDHGLAALGDAYTNFIYSLHLSRKNKEPKGAKAKGYILAEALKRADLRKLLPTRTSRHEQADAAEALLVYVWLQGLTTIVETVNTFGADADLTDSFSLLLSSAVKKLEKNVL